MNRLFLTIAIAATLTCASLAQSTLTATVQDAAQTQTPATTVPQSPPQAPTQPTEASQPQSGTPRIAAGSIIPVQLTKTVDAKKAKTGDEVVAKVTQDLRTATGEVLMPKDTKVIGHVTGAQARNKEQKESELAISFDHAVLKDGNSVQLPMSIQAVIGQQNNNNGGQSAPAGTYGGASPNTGGGMPAGGAGRTGSMGGSPPAPTPSAGGMAPPPPDENNPPSHPVINAQTQGVVGISDMTLGSAQSPDQGSLMTSEKNNVKLESGTMLLLKVKPQQ